MLVGLLVLVAGCTSGGSAGSANLPAAGGLLATAGDSMRSVTSVHFSIVVNGTLAGVPIQNADGDLNAQGQAKGNAKVSLLGQLTQVDFVLVDQTFYLKGPTGGYQSEDAANLYDVSQLLDPTNGLAGTLGQATNGSAVSSDSVSSTPAYKLTASVPTTILKGLADLAPGQDTVVATLWVAQNGNRLVKAIIPFKVQGATSNTVVTAQLSDFDVPVSIPTPSTS